MNSRRQSIDRQPAYHADMMVDVGDCELFVSVTGQGFPVLIFHGGPGLDHHAFGDYLDPLTEDYQLVFVDERASGRSARPDLKHLVVRLRSIEPWCQRGSWRSDQGLEAVTTICAATESEAIKVLSNTGSTRSMAMSISVRARPVPSAT